MSYNLTIIAATFHRQLADEMIEAATKQLAEQGANLAETIEVPGSYEIPLIAQQAIKAKKSDALIVLAYIEKGETLHGEVMWHVVHQSLINLQLKHGIPMGLGIIGPGATEEQAKVRATPSAKHARRSEMP